MLINLLIIYFVAASMASIAWLLLTLSLLLPLAQVASVSPSNCYNRFMAAYYYTLSFTTPRSGIDTYYYNSTFTNMIELPARVYYSTQCINAQIMSNSPLGQKVIKYSISSSYITKSSLETRIWGYFESPYIKLFHFRSLLILPSNPWIGRYMVIQEFTFSSGTTQNSTQLPSLYSSGNTISSAVMIKDIRFQFNDADLPSNKVFFLNWTSTTSLTTFSVSLGVPSYISIYTIRYLIIIIDSTALDRVFPQYQFKTDSISSISSTKAQAVPFNLGYQYANYIFGLSQMYIQLNNDPSFSFTLGASTSTSVIGTFHGSVSSGFLLSWKYQFAVFPFFQCTTTSYPIYNATDDRCYDYCPQYYFFNSSRLCSPCRFDCLTCYDGTLCRSCNNITRYFKNFSCLPNDGFYESNMTIALPCNTICRTCTGMSTFCTSCSLNLTRALVNNTCIICSILFEGCSTCNETACFSCTSLYRLINSKYCNLNCSDINCAVCSNTNTSFCYICNSNFFRVNRLGSCISTCGDGIVQNTQACDDGNRILHDGCDNDCLEEPGYRCYSSPLPITFYPHTLYCAYTQPIQFSVVSVEKIDYSNQLSIVISVQQYLETFWNTRSVLNYCFVQTPVPFRNLQISFMSQTYRPSAKLTTPIINSYPQGSLMKVVFEYLKPIHNQTVYLSFNFSRSTDLALVQIPPYAVAVPINPENNLAAHLYTQSSYHNQKMLSNFFTFAEIVALVLLLVSFVIGGKRVIVEMLVVFQLNFISLISVPVVTPMLSSVTSLALANNGYNVLSNTSLRPVEDVLSDGRVKGMLLYSQFLYNINAGLLFILLPLVIGFVVFIISKIKQHSQAKLKKIQGVYRSALGQFVYIGLMLTSCIIGGSFVIEIKFGMTEIDTMIGRLSLILSACFLALYPIYLIIRVKCNQCFSEYHSFINEETFSLIFQLIYFLLGLLLSAALCVFCNYKYINCCIAAIAFILYFITIFKVMFKKQIDHYRTQFNLLTIVLTQIPFAYSNFNTNLQYSSESELTIMMPLLLGIFLGLNLLGNFCIFVYLAIKKWREIQLEKEKLAKKEQAKEQSVQNEKFQQLYKNSLISPLTYLKVPKFISSFIEQQQKDPEEIQLKEYTKKNKHSMYNSNQPLEKVTILEQDYIQSKFSEIDQL